MENVFLKLLNMSITASWLVLAVVVLRLILKKAPKWINIILWALVGFRLICPFSFESVLSLIPSTETIPDNVMQGPSFDVNTGINFVDNTVNDYLGSHYFEGVTVPTDTGITIINILSIFWLSGIIGMLLYAFISFSLLHKKVREGVMLKDNIWLCDRIDTPFILGLFSPRIFLPSSINEADMEYVLAHEKAHLKRNDHWWKPIGFLLLTVYWFNPVMWLAYILLCRDIELACDEKVIKEMGIGIKKPYSEALINCSVPRKSITACPLAFGETGVKGRIKSVLNYKKPAFWVILIAVVSCIIVAVFFLTNPVSSNGIVERIVNENGYTITNQEKIEVTLSIPKTSLPESIYSEKGYEFENNEVVAYKDDVTTIFLKQVRFSNEGNKNLYFCFDFSYDTPKDGGKLLSPRGVGEKSSFVLSNSFVLSKKDKTMRDQNTEYTDAVQVRGQGDNNLIWFYVSTDVLRQAEGTISFDIYLNRITYLKDGVTTSDNALDYTKAADIVQDKANITAMHYPVSENEEWSILIGEAYGSDVADYLDNVSWKMSTVPLDSLSSPGSVEFVIDEDYRITVHKRKSGSLFAYAVVKVNNEEIYYHASYDDYEKAVAILHTPESITADPNEKFNSPVTWTYSPMLSATFHSFFYINFDFDYTYVNTTCKNGQMQNLDAEGQPKATSLRFKKGENVCWTPEEADTKQVPYSAEVNFTVYNGDEQLYYGSIVFYCVERKSGSATYEVYLQDSNGLILLQKDMGVYLVEAENTVTTGNVDKPENYSEIPKLVVAHENEGIFAWTGTATWTFTMDNGKAQTINADGHHVSNRIDEISKHYAINVDDRAETSSIVKLNFEIVPDSIKVNSLLITKKGNIKAFSPEVNGLNIIHKNTNETCLYEVVAEWNSSDKYNGKIHYAFCVNSEQLDISLLREKYPQFFDLSTDGGLTVYIWQMAKYNYSCYLINSSLDAVTDQSFAFTEGASISEMRAILSTYDIDRNDVTLRPCSNPISSYVYIIDDAYIKKLEEKFWS